MVAIRTSWIWSGSTLLPVISIPGNFSLVPGAVVREGQSFGGSGGPINSWACRLPISISACLSINCSSEGGSARDRAGFPPSRKNPSTPAPRSITSPAGCSWATSGAWRSSTRSRRSGCSARYKRPAELFRSADRLHHPARCPGPCCHRERGRRQHFEGTFTQLRCSSRFEAGGVGACRAHAESERLPPLLKARMFDANFENRLLDLAQPGLLEQLR